MSFGNVNGMKLVSSSHSNKYILADCFAVYEQGSPIPLVYKWNNITSVHEGYLSFTIKTKSGNTYNLGSDYFAMPVSFMQARAIIGGFCSIEKINYIAPKSFIPPKNLYISSEIPENVYGALETYKTTELLSEHLAVTNKIASKFIWIIAIVIIAVTLILFNNYKLMAGSSWWLYVLLALGIGIIGSIIVYFIYRGINSSLFKTRLSKEIIIDQPIIFIISSKGFAAVEECVKSINELIPWESVTDFLETDDMFHIYKNNTKVLWLPKRFFSNEVSRKITQVFIKSGLNEK